MPERSHPAFTDGTHVLISGVTGSGADFGGKTTTAAWWMDTAVESGHFQYGIAFSPKGNRFPGPTVTSAREAANAVANGKRIIEWTVDGRPGSVGSLHEEHANCMDFVSGVNGDVLAVHDDAVMYSGADSLSWATALAGNPAPGENRVKSLVVSQDPWDLPRKGVRTNLPVLVWVGPSGSAERYFDCMKKSDAYELVNERHTEPYMWSVVDGDDNVITFAPVDERYA
jgi:hypothetical protein